jgi:hypothetical protein
VLTVFWMRSSRVPVRGDEPHYLIMTVSLIEDGDLRLKNNYEIECVAGEIYGCVAPHAFPFEHAWVPYHQAGLSFLIAPFYSIARIGGARLTTVAIASLLPLLLTLWLQQHVTGRDAVLFTLAACLSVPFLFGASALYPDLPAGVLVFGLTWWLINSSDRPDTRSTLSWMAFWLLAGLLCWLNLKFILATAILSGWALVVLRPTGRWKLHPAHATALAVLIGPCALAAFHYWGFGNIIGGRGGTELTSSPMRALLFFLGLHLDQAQGLFVQNPFLLAGVPALVIWARRKPFEAMAWTLLYLSLVATNSLQMGRYGGDGPAGRYGWTAEWLWMIPIALVATQQAPLLRRWAMAAIMYQTLLAMRWVPDPLTLYPIYEEQLSARNSLFPTVLRAAFPSFYDWSYARYLSYPQNIAGILVIGLLLVIGWRQSRQTLPNKPRQDVVTSNSR